MNETGRGRLFLDRSKWHDDLRLLQVARKRRWEIDDDFRETIVRRLRVVIEEGDDEIALKAIAETRHMEAQNQRDEHKAVDEFSNRLLELAGQLGIDTSAIGVGEAPCIGSESSDGESAIADKD